MKEKVILKHALLSLSAAAKNKLTGRQAEKQGGSDWEKQQRNEQMAENAGMRGGQKSI